MLLHHQSPSNANTFCTEQTTIAAFIVLSLPQFVSHNLLQLWNLHSNFFEWNFNRKVLILHYQLVFLCSLVKQVSIKYRNSYQNLITIKRGENRKKIIMIFHKQNKLWEHRVSWPQFFLATNMFPPKSLLIPFVSSLFTPHFQFIPVPLIPVV